MPAEGSKSAKENSTSIVPTHTNLPIFAVIFSAKTDSPNNFAQTPTWRSFGTIEPQILILIGKNANVNTIKNTTAATITASIGDFYEIILEEYQITSRKQTVQAQTRNN